MAFLAPRRSTMRIGLGLVSVFVAACGGSTMDPIRQNDPVETPPDPDRSDPPRKRGSVALFTIDGSFAATASFWTASVAKPSAPIGDCRFSPPSDGVDYKEESAG